MILDLQDVNDRLNSAHNLLNNPDLKGRRVENPKSITQRNTEIANTPKITELVENADDTIQLALSKTSAVSVLNLALGELKGRLGDVEKPRDLSRIAVEMSKIVSDREPKINSIGNQQQIIIWQPMMIAPDEMNVVNVNE